MASGNVKMVLICMVALVAASCSWTKATRVPDNWTPSKKLTCDTGKVPLVKNIALASTLGGVLTANELELYKKDGQRDWATGAMVLGSFTAVATAVAWSSGLVWQSSCGKAKKERSDWLESQRVSSLVPLKDPAGD